MKRERDIDILRAIGIMVMIIDHIGFGGGVYKWSHAFHMPLFFIVSGYFFSEIKCKKNLRKYLFNKSKKLLLPYFVFAVGSYCVWAILKHDRPILAPLYNIFWYNSEGVPIVTAVWFLTCLFLVEVIFCFCVRMIKGHYLRCGLSVMVIAAIGIILGKVPEIRTVMPYSILPAMVCLPFFFVGFILRSFSTKIHMILNRIHPIITGLLCLVSTGLIWMNIAVNIRFVRTGNVFLFYFNAIFMTLLLWSISCYIDSMGKNCNFIDEIASIGKNSIVYLCLNQVAITGCEIISVFFSFNMKTPLYKILCFLVVMGILRLATIVFTSSRLCVLIGGKYEHKNIGSYA